MYAMPFDMLPEGLSLFRMYVPFDMLQEEYSFQETIVKTDHVPLLFLLYICHLI